MPWVEPLTASSAMPDDWTVDVTVYAGDGTPIAAVRSAVNLAARTGMFGELRLLSTQGAPRQRLRALVLLVREAMRFAADRAITHAWTEAPPSMATFAARLSGMTGEPHGRGLRFGGELHAMRSAALAASDDTGALVERGA